MMSSCKPNSPSQPADEPASVGDNDDVDDDTIGTYLPEENVQLCSYRVTVQAQAFGMSDCLGAS